MSPTCAISMYLGRENWWLLNTLTSPLAGEGEGLCLGIVVNANKRTKIVEFAECKTREKDASSSSEYNLSTEYSSVCACATYHRATSVAVDSLIHKL